jgi:hypothetical protein
MARRIGGPHFGHRQSSDPRDGRTLLAIIVQGLSRGLTVNQVRAGIQTPCSGGGNC